MEKIKQIKYLHTASRSTEVDPVSDQIVAIYEVRTALKTEPYLGGYDGDIEKPIRTDYGGN